MHKDRSAESLGANAGTLAIDILRNDFHRPFIDGKANRDNIEEAVTVGMLSGNLLYYVDQEVVDLAIDIINDMIQENRNKLGVA